MKRLFMFLCAMTLVFGMVGTASAIPYTDVYDAGPEGTEGLYMSGSLFGPKDSIAWIFDITEDGFDPDIQDVTSAYIKLKFQDDGYDYYEGALLVVGENWFVWEVDTGGVSITIKSLMTLSDTGTVNVTLVCLAGDFIFNGARLTAEGTEPGAAPVPEPSTVLLMGSGLLGLVGYSRKRFSKKELNRF